MAGGSGFELSRFGNWWRLIDGAVLKPSDAAGREKNTVSLLLRGG